jgi:hypothetical protein
MDIPAGKAGAVIIVDFMLASQVSWERDPGQLGPRSRDA